MTNDPSKPDHAAPEIDPSPYLAVAERPDVELTHPGNTTKFNIMAVLAAVVPLLLAVASQPNATAGQWAQGIAGALGAGAVYVGAYNETWYKSPKMYMMGLAAVLTAVAPLITNGVTGNGFELTSQQISVVVLTAVGAFIAAIIPNSQGQDNRPLKAAVAELYPDGATTYDVSTLAKD